MRPALLCGIVFMLASCSVDPKLLLYDRRPPDSDKLDDLTNMVMGERGSVVLTYGSDGSELVGDTLRYTDNQGSVWEAANPALAVSQVSAKHVEFSVPKGSASGVAHVSLATKKELRFEGSLMVIRIIIVRDQAGKIWYVSIQDRRGEEGDFKATQYYDSGHEPFAFELGKVAVSPSGTFIAVSSRRQKTVTLATVERDPKITNPVSFANDVLELAFLPNEDLLVVTGAGIYKVAKPHIADHLALTAETWLAETGAKLAISRSGERGALLRVPTSAAESYFLVPLDLSVPAAQTPIKLDWPFHEKASTDLMVTPDASAVFAVHSEIDKVFRITIPDGALAEYPLPADQRGPAAITGTKDGLLYFVANEKSRNISQATLENGQLKFTDLAIGLTLTLESGAVVQMTMSDHDEAALLFEHDLFLLWREGTDTKAKRLEEFPDLFRDQIQGQVGASVAIQP